MSEEELNQELSTDELKDVAGGPSIIDNTRATTLSSVLGTRARSKKLDRDQIDTNPINSEGSAEEGLMGMRNGAK